MCHAEAAVNLSRQSANLQGKNYVFTTEGHIIPILPEFHDPSTAPDSLPQLPQHPPTPMKPPQSRQTVVVTPDQP